MINKKRKIVFSGFMLLITVFIAFGLCACPLTKPLNVHADYDADYYIQIDDILGGTENIIYIKQSGAYEGKGYTCYSKKIDYELEEISIIFDDQPDVVYKKVRINWMEFGQFELQTDYTIEDEFFVQHWTYEKVVARYFEGLEIEFEGYQKASTAINNHPAPSNRYKCVKNDVVYRLDVLTTNYVRHVYEFDGYANKIIFGIYSYVDFSSREYVEELVSSLEL